MIYFTRVYDNIIQYSLRFYNGISFAFKMSFGDFDLRNDKYKPNNIFSVTTTKRTN